MVNTQYWNLPPQASANRRIIICCHARMVVDKFVVPKDHKLSARYKRWIGPSDPWTIGLFFGPFFWTIFFWTSFGPFSLDLLLNPFLDHFFRPFYRRGGRPLGCSLSVLRKGWEASCCSYIRAVFRQTIFTSNCLRWTAAFLYFFGMRMRNWHLNTGQ